ncbi:MAG: hypothetical protein LC642_08580 [Verrucomicrobiaceae bacterium]|nr:hypothetical protein [Verrucomicrobiaceae bacterium]
MKLEVRSNRHERNIEFEILAGKIARELFANGVEIPVLARHDIRLQALAQDGQFSLQRATVGELKQA